MELVVKMGLKRYSLVLASLLIIALGIVVAPVSAGNTVTIGPGTDMINQSMLGALGAGGTLILNPGTYYQNSPVTIYNNTLIESLSAGGIPTINGAGSDSGIFVVNSGVPLAIDNLTLENGNSGGSGGAINNGGAS